MSAPQRYMLADSYETAEALDATVCQFLRVRDGSKGTQWAGISQRADGRFGVLYAEDCAAALGQNLPAFDVEKFDKDGESNWSAYVAPTTEDNSP